MSGCVVIEISDAESWAPFRGCKRLPLNRQPTILHPSREVAEQEALRLATEHPQSRFVVFEAAIQAHSVQLPTHITLSGVIVASRHVAALAEVDSDEVPF